MNTQYIHSKYYVYDIITDDRAMILEHSGRWLSAIVWPLLEVYLPFWPGLSVCWSGCLKRGEGANLKKIACLTVYIYIKKNTSGVAGARDLTPPPPNTTPLCTAMSLMLFCQIRKWKDKKKANFKNRKVGVRVKEGNQSNKNKNKENIKKSKKQWKM